jgi:hypothetical protein
VSDAQDFFLTGHILLGRAASFSLLTGRRSVSGTFFSLSRATFSVQSLLVCAHRFFFVLSGQQLLRMQEFFLFFFSLSGHFLCWAGQIIFFLFAAAQQGLRLRFFFPGPVSRCVHAESFFFWVCMQSPVTSSAGRVRLLFFVFVCLLPLNRVCAPLFLSGRFSSMRASNFFWGCPVSSCACGNLFSLCPVTSLLGACSFFWTLLLSPRAMHACQGRQFFFPVQSLLAAARKIFSQPHTTAVCAAFCSCDQSPCHPRSKETFAVRSHLRRHLVLIFFFFAHGISAVHFFRILRQKFDFFWHLPSAVSGSLTTLVRTS